MADLEFVADVHSAELPVSLHCLGLLGLVPFVVDESLAIYAFELHRWIALSCSALHDRCGCQRAIVRPFDDAARVAIDAQNFLALGIKAAEAAP